MTQAQARLEELLDGYPTVEKDGEKAAELLVNLFSLLKNYNYACSDSLVDRSVPKLVLQLIKTHLASTVVQKVGCQLISSCYLAGGKLQEMMLDCHALDEVLHVILTHQEDPSVLVQAFDTLHTLSDNEENLKKLVEHKMSQHLVLMLARYKEQDIQTATLKLLAIIPSSDLSDLVASESIKLIVGAVKLYPDTPVIAASVLEVLAAMSFSDEKRCQLLQCADCLRIANSCVKYHRKEDPVVARAYCKFMQNISESDDLDYATEILDTSLMNTVERELVDRDLKIHIKLTKLLRIHPGDATVQEHGLAAMEHLAVLPGVLDDCEHTKMSVWMKLIHSALKNHLNSPAVQTAACLCLAQTLVSKPDIIKWIGVDPSPTSELVPVHSAIVLPLIVYNSDPQVYVAACSAIYHIMSIKMCTGAVLQELTDRALSSTLEGLHEHRRNLVCLTWGCRALRTLIMDRSQYHTLYSDDKKFKEYIEMCQVLFDLLGIVEQPDANAEVLGEAFAAITCLTDSEDLREEACQQHVYTKVLDAVDKHQTDKFLSEVAIEQLSILVLSDGMVDTLNDVNTLSKVVWIMKKHLNVPSIQKKGCMLIRKLSDENLIMQDVSLESLANTVIDAMLHRRSDPDVQVEGLSCVLKLCTVSDEIAGHFVTSGIHNLVLTILQQVEQEIMPLQEEEDEQTISDKHFILDVAKDILTLLCAKIEYKHKMLSLAVKDNLLEGVNILIDMGADVNSYEDTDESPICLAVQNGNTMMVVNLLAEGVRVVTTALNIAKQNGLNSIIGILLRHIAREVNKGSLDNKSSDVVDLGGLQLQKIRLDWILPALGAATLSRRPSLSLFRRLKHTESFQHHRRNFSDSEISIYSDTGSDDGNLSTLIGGEDDTTGSSGSIPISITGFSPPEHDDNFSPPNKTRLHRISRSPDHHKLPPIMSPMHGSLNVSQGNAQNYTVWGPTISPSLDESLFYASSSEHTSPVRRRRTSDTFHSKPVFNFSITGAKNIPFHGKSNSLKRDGLDHSNELFAPPTNELLKRAHSMRCPGRSHSNSRAPSPSTGVRDNSRSSSFSYESYAYTPPSLLSYQTPPLSTYVRRLNLSCNFLSSLDSLSTDDAKTQALYDRIKKLEVLELQQNNLDNLPEQLFKRMVSLRVINLQHNHFEFFPKEVFSSYLLSEVYLSNNKIRFLPSFSVQFPNITLLAFNSNQLQDFPAVINGRNFPRLSKLYLSSNLMTVIPNQVFGLTRLEELVVSKNKLPEIPGNFVRDMASLKLLNASDNEIVRLPDEEAGYLGNLNIVKLNNNLLGKNEQNFHNFVTSLPCLHTLEARHNGLTILYPPFKWESQSIKDLDFCGNNIEQLNLDQCDTRWSQLERLLLGSNKIKTIPVVLGNIRSLCCLDLSHNSDITKLPNELGNLSSLYVLRLDGLTRLSIDASVLSGTARTIINFLEARLHQSERYYQMKLLVVGGPNKGKTSLLECLIRSKPLKAPLATLGVNIREWSYEQRPGERYHLSCWDFAGQGEFYSTHQCFLTKRSLYMVVYDLSKGEEELATISPWLLNIQARAPSSPIIIVGTHRDLVAGEFAHVKNKMRSKIRNLTDHSGFPSSKDVSFAEVSCLDGNGMKQLRHKLKELIDNAKVKGQKIMGGYVPSYYLVLAELIRRKAAELANSPFPVMYEEELKDQLSRDRTLRSLPSSELQQAILFLHQCGVLLHYSDYQTELGRLYFLDPEWLCKLMARVVTIPEVNPGLQEGLLPVDRLPLILRPPEFPEKYMTEYIRLLERFEVAFRQTPKLLLIPSHLPMRRPSTNLPATAPGGEIIRCYQMSYIPPGFWPRLTARLLIFPKRALQVFDQKSCFNNDPQTKCWRHGVYSLWSEQAYFLVEQLSDQLFHITLPNTTWGTRLLCAVVDNVEALIDEWYPGLRDFDVATGEKLVSSGAICPHCPPPNDPYCFQLKDLEEQAYYYDEVTCPQHHGRVLLEQLAPDVIINDLDHSLKVVQGEFALDESVPNLLGRGGFGEVYKAVYRRQTVAVKVFNASLAELNGTTPTHLIRQEVSILSCLSHPHIISLVGVCVRPKPMLLLEYAPLGSLRTVDYGKLSYNTKHAIMAQVASGLAYLHKNSIIYRDLKADNILMFSLNPTAPVAKISDYGIARFATASGLAADMGTCGYKAPEVMKGHSSGSYNKEADLYSYGILLFNLITNHKPFDYLPDARDQDKAVKENKPVNSIQYYGCPPWPDMEDLISSCLQETPTLRPSAQQVYNRLCTAELIGLKRVIPTLPGLSVEAFTTRTFISEDTNSHNVELWMVSLCGSETVLSVINLTQKKAMLEGKMLPDRNRINCILTVDANTILLGGHNGVIHVYDSNRCQRSKLAALPSSVLCMLHYQTYKGSHYVCAGLLDGTIALYDQYELQIENANARIFSMGEGPISCMKRQHHKLYVCCGEEVLEVYIADFTIQHRWNAAHPSFHGKSLRCLELGLNMVWTAQRHCSHIQLWDIETRQHRGTLPCSELVKSHLQKEGLEYSEQLDLRVTCIYLKEAPLAELWVGLGTGHLLIVNASTRVPLMVVWRHLGPIRCMGAVKASVTGKTINLVLTGSYGFIEQPNLFNQDTAVCDGNREAYRHMESYGSVLVWDAAMPQLKPVMDKYRDRQSPYK